MKIIVFDNDSDFEFYCLKPKYEINQSEISGTLYYDLAFTDTYIKDVKDGVMFCIDDPKSKVVKRGCVTRGVVSKRVDNLLDVEAEDIPILYRNAEIERYTLRNNNQQQ